MAKLSEKAKKTYEKMELGKEYSSLQLGTNRAIMNQLMAARLIKRRLVKTSNLSHIESGVVYRREA